MKKFDLVRDLVQSLNDGESRLFEKFLVSFDEVKGPESMKMLTLFKVLRTVERTVSEEEVMRRVSPGYRPGSFSKLISRLRDRIYDTLTLDANIFRPDAYSEQYQKRIHIRKLTSVASIVHGRGNIPLALEIYEKVIVTCKEFEIYTELCEALSITQQINGISEGIEIYNNIQEQVEFYEKCRREVLKAKHYHYQLMSRIDFTGSPDKEKQILIDRIEELKISLAETNSAFIEYYLLHLQMELAQNNSDYELATEHNYRLVELVKTNKAVYLKRALAMALNELSFNLQLLGRFSDSLEKSKESLSLLPENSFNSAVAKEISYISYLYLGDYSAAEEVINDLLENKYYNRSEFIKSKRTYYKANLAFFKKEFLLAHNLLSECRELENDREGFNIGIRFLSIINDIERGLYDIADNKIESLRKFISRSKTPVAERFIIGQKIFAHLVKNSYDFKKTYQANEHLFKLLEREHPWKLRTAELLPFEEWFLTRTQQSTYHFDPSRIIRKK